MNYLAHLYLSQENGLSMAGNLMADFLKTVELDALPSEIVDGIENHRMTDKFTDSHPLVLSLKEVFHPDFRRFVPIILDVSFDHMLARHWGKFHEQSLTEFTAKAYQRLATVEQYMPEDMKIRMGGIARRDGLAAYIELDTVEKTLQAISGRIRFENHLDLGFAEVEAHYDKIEEVFLQFFPELVQHIQTLGLEREVL